MRRASRWRPRRHAEKWRIAVPQLVMLLEMSESSSYWLILSTGELLCVTARWLHGLAQGREALSQGSVTVGYNDVRHTAVPIEQFLPELFPRHMARIPRREDAQVRQRRRQQRDATPHL